MGSNYRRCTLDRKACIFSHDIIGTNLLIITSAMECKLATISFAQKKTVEKDRCFKHKLYLNKHDFKIVIIKLFDDYYQFLLQYLSFSFNNGCYNYAYNIS